MKPGRNIRKYITLLGLFLLLLISAFFYVNTLLKRPDVQQYMIKKVCLALGMEIEAGKMELDIAGLTGVKIHDAKIIFKKGSGVIKAREMNIRFSKRRLIMGELMPASIEIGHPVVNLSEQELITFLKREKKGAFDLSAIFRGGFKTLEIKEGELKVEGPSSIRVKNFSVRVEQTAGVSIPVKISGKGEAWYRDKKAGFNIEGFVEVNTDDVRESTFKITLKTDGAPLEWIPWPNKYVQMKKGLVDSSLDISGSIADGIAINGTINTKSVLFTLINEERSKSFKIDSLNCSVNASVKGKTIEVTSLKIKNHELDFDLESTIDLRNEDNPYFRLRVKGPFIPIEVFSRYFPFQITSPWLKDKLFPLFEHGRVRMNELLVNGRADQFENLSDEKSKSVIGLSLTCESFTLSNMGIRMPVSQVSATVDIRDNNLAVKGLSGVFGQSQVIDASVIVNGLTDDIPVFNITVEGDFDIQELLTHRYLEVIPGTAREKIDLYSELTGRLSGKTLIGYRDDWKGPRVLKGDFTFTETLYHKRPLTLPLKLSRIVFHFPDDAAGSFEGSGFFGDMPFDVTGSTRIREEELLFTSAEINGQADMNILVKSGVMPGSFPFSFRKSLPAKVAVSEDNGVYRYKGEVDTKNLVMETDSLLINAVGRGNRITFDLVHPDSSGLLLNNIGIRIGKSLITLSGDYNLEDKRLKNLKIMGNDMDLQGIELRTNGKKNNFSGNVGCDLDLSFFEKGMQITGNIMGNNLSLEKGVFPLSIADLSFYMDLAGKKGYVKKWDMKLDGHPLKIKGMLHGWERVSAELLITSEYLDLTEIIMGKEETNPWHNRDMFITPDIHLKMKALGGVWRKLAFSSLSTEIDISEHDISIKKFSADLENGKLSINGTLDRSESGNIDIAGRVSLEGKPIDKLLSDTGFDDLGIKGSLSINSSLSIKGLKEDGVIKNLSGTIETLTVTQGLLNNSQVFLKILETLNIPDKFIERPSEMREDKGFYFQSLNGTGLIDKGVLKTEEFVIKSPAFNAVGSGEENLDLKTHNIRLLVQPLGNLDFILSHIPIVGRILVDDNETLFTVGYDVTGTWSKPKMVIVPTENLKGLIGVFKRALLTPVRIIEDIGNAAKGGAKTAPDIKDEGEKREDVTP